jgi:hypothetical protein
MAEISSLEDLRHPDVKVHVFVLATDDIQVTAKSTAGKLRNIHRA